LQPASRVLLARAAAEFPLSGVQENTAVQEAAPVPTQDRRQKKRARASTPETVQNFLEILNDGRTTLSAGSRLLFDAHLYPSHQRLRNDLTRVSDHVLRRAQREQVPLWTRGIRYGQIMIGPHSVFEVGCDETPDAAVVRYEIAFVMQNLIDFFFVDKSWAGYLCLSRCERQDCRRWFFATDDRQRFHDPSCQPRNQPANCAARVGRHRVSRRNT
jgi:hypothetical protein